MIECNGVTVFLLQNIYIPLYCYCLVYSCGLDETNDVLLVNCQKSVISATHCLNILINSFLDILYWLEMLPVSADFFLLKQEIISKV